MKATILITLFYLLFASTIDIPLASSQGSEYAADIYGNPVRLASDEGYFILPYFNVFPKDGGLRPGEIRNDSNCAVTLLQNYNIDVGVAVRIDTSMPADVLLLGLQVRFSFVKSPECAEFSRWLFISDDNYPWPFAGFGGVGDHPGNEIMNGTFMVKKHYFGYKLQFCTGTICSYVGRRDDQNGRRLVLNNNPDESYPPFQIVFVPASSSSQVSEYAADIYGNPVRLALDEGYFILPYFNVFPKDGGLKPDEIRNDSNCVATVLQNYNIDVGAAVRIDTSMPADVLLLGLQVRFSFVKSPECAEFSRWLFINDDNYPWPYAGFGGVGDHPGNQIMNGTFMVKKHYFGYKLQFCTSTSCSYVGRRDDQNGRRLVLNNNAESYPPFEIVFVPAGATAKSNGNRSIVSFK